MNTLDTESSKEWCDCYFVDSDGRHVVVYVSNFTTLLPVLATADRIDGQDTHGYCRTLRNLIS